MTIGPQTSFALESLQHLLEHDDEPAVWRPEDISDANPNDWPKQTPEADVIRYYGEVNLLKATIIKISIDKVFCFV
ncbi:hypothetical protein IH970_03425 [candidate division KSB1 bacterium]|nr:hypothetical protein [candidate division KSB1 bacterium]